jgi:beta-N-acetylhexosaminidase
MAGARQLDGQSLSYIQAALAALNAGCDMVLLCNQSLDNAEGGAAALDDLISGLEAAQKTAQWLPCAASGERRMALLPRTAPWDWSSLMVQPEYMHALDFVL